jgi:hypothetical protein
MEYAPPAGLAGHTVASFLGQDPKSAMDEDLNRLKTLIEQGSIHKHGSIPEQGGISTESLPPGGEARRRETGSGL